MIEISSPPADVDSSRSVPKATLAKFHLAISSITPICWLGRMDPQQKLQSMLAELWNQHRSAIEERVELLSRACDALHQGTLDPDRRKEAQSAAHKLAGVLGTFGRSEGTDLARRIEILLSDTESLHLHHDEIEIAVGALRKAIL